MVATIGGLLSAIGVAGMSRMLGANVIATSGRAVEAAGDVDVLLLDKTGTITLGNRQASEFLPAPGVDEKTLADAAQLSSLADVDTAHSGLCRKGDKSGVQALHITLAQIKALFRQNDDAAAPQHRHSGETAL